MKKLLLCVSVLCYTVAQAQDPLFSPTSNITTIGVVDSPAAEGVENIIDGDVMTKYLDFEEKDGTGFEVDLNGTEYVATSFEITTANDAELRDPTIVVIYGSNNGTDFTEIANVAIPCIVERFETRSFDFDNTESFSIFRVDFVQECDDIEGIIQVAEFQLFGSEPLSVDENTLNNNISITPNPSNGLFTLAYNGTQDIHTIQVTDMNGRNIYNQDVVSFDNELVIDLQRFNTGIYFISAFTNATVLTRKLQIK